MLCDSKNDGIKKLGDPLKGEFIKKMKKIIGFILCLTLFLTLGFVNQAHAEEEEDLQKYQFSVKNKSEDDLVVNIIQQQVIVTERTATYEDRTFPFETYRQVDKLIHTFKVPAGESDSQMLDEGTYIVEYNYCGKDYDWEIELDEPFTMTLYPCRSQPTKIQVKSHLNEEVELKIYGYDDMEVKVKPGAKMKVDLYSGNIDYEYVACGGQTFFGELKVAKNGTTQLVMHSCEWHLSPARNYAQPNPVKFRIINHASFSIIMTLIGPESYLVTVDPGINVFTLISGNYRYSYYQDGKLLTGNMVVTQNGLGTLVVTPSFVMDYVDETADLE